MLNEGTKMYTGEKGIFFKRTDGKYEYCTRVWHVRRVKTGKYRVYTTHGFYDVVGGKSYGGGAREWFCDPTAGCALKGSINVTSVQDAVKLLEGC